jgi:hypothetical protein
MDHPDYILMRAPKPTLMCVATQDFFDIEGAWSTFREAKRMYTRMGYAERVDLIETDAKHGFSVELREGMVRWMKRWLMGIDKPVLEPEIIILTDAEAQCTETGNVHDLPGAKSGYDLNVERAERLKMERANLGYKDRVDKIFELTGASKNGKTLSGQFVRKWGDKNDSEQTGYIEAEDGVKLPLHLYLPKKKSSAVVLYLHEDGKSTITQEFIESALAKGHAVCAVDLRGYGGTKPKGNPSNWKDTVGNDWADFKRAYLLGRSFVGMRVDDINLTANTMRSLLGDDVELHIHAVGSTTVPAMHAAALFPGRFPRFNLVEGLSSWEDVVREPYAKHVLMNTVHNALSVYDLSDLVSLMPEDAITIVNSHVPTFVVR